METISRADLLYAVEKALPRLRIVEDQAAVWHWATRTDRFAAGAWKVEDCRCPASAVGIDRFQHDAQDFAAEFDYRIGVTPDDPLAFLVKGAA